MSSSLGRALARLLPAISVVAFVLTVGATLAVAGNTLGYDFRSYYDAASRALAGQPLYGATAADTGINGGFKYPPPFVLLVLPFGVLPWESAALVWIVVTIGAFLLGTALMPVRPTVRWAIVLLAALSFPFVYATKLGQVGSLLYLLFAIGWRGLDRPVVLGAAGALGALVKLQPGVVLVWALLTRRWRAVLVGGTVLFAALVLSAVAFGPGAWADFVSLSGRIDNPITTARNLAPGAVAYQLGVSSDVATLVQAFSTVAAGVLLVLAAVCLGAVPSYLIAVTVSQLVSPIAWEHYAMILLLPTAWLLDRGRWWAVLIPLATSLPLTGLVPAVVYPLSYWVVLAAIAFVGQQDRATATAS